jgi:hypothetical protein
MANANVAVPIASSRARRAKESGIGKLTSLCKIETLNHHSHHRCGQL